MAPLSVLENLGGTPGLFAVHLILGILFGAVLEQSGFGDSRVLAAQFYLNKMTVLKVMFMAIITACLLIFLASGLGLVDYTHLWVNPTYLLPGVVGGIVMGIGFVIGGYCPGTSLVSMATLKIDGLFFVLGGLAGVAIFGNTVDASFVNWWSSDVSQRFILPDWLNISVGWTVFLVVLLAISFFKGAEWLESRFGGEHEARLPLWGVAILLLAASATIFLGQPTPLERWKTVKPDVNKVFQENGHAIHPGELVEIWFDTRIKLNLLDIRNESDYNKFHLQDVKHLDSELMTETELVAMRYLDANVVHILISENGLEAEALWKKMKAYDINNVYILKGGMENWAKVFQHLMQTPVEPISGWNGYLGSIHPLSVPDAHWIENLDYPKKVKLEFGAKVAQGGCG